MNQDSSFVNSFFYCYQTTALMCDEIIDFSSIDIFPQTSRTIYYYRTYYFIRWRQFFTHLFSNLLLRLCEHVFCYKDHSTQRTSFTFVVVIVNRWIVENFTCIDECVCICLMKNQLLFQTLYGIQKRAESQKVCSVHTLWAHITFLAKREVHSQKKIENKHIRTIVFLLNGCLAGAGTAEWCAYEFPSR